MNSSRVHFSFVFLSSASHGVAAGGGVPGLVWQLHALRLQPGSRQLARRGWWSLFQCVNSWTRITARPCAAARSHVPVHQLTPRVIDVLQFLIHHESCSAHHCWTCCGAVNKLRRIPVLTRDSLTLKHERVNLLHSKHGGALTSPRTLCGVLLLPFYTEGQLTCRAW